MGGDQAKVMEMIMNANGYEADWLDIYGFFIRCEDMANGWSISWQPMHGKSWYVTGRRDEHPIDTTFYLIKELLFKACNERG